MIEATIFQFYFGFVQLVLYIIYLSFLRSVKNTTLFVIGWLAPKIIGKFSLLSYSTTLCVT